LQLAAAIGDGVTEREHAERLRRYEVGGQGGEATTVFANEVLNIGE
jgi:hypothetical protein